MKYSLVLPWKTRSGKRLRIEALLVAQKDHRSHIKHINFWRKQNALFIRTFRSSSSRSVIRNKPGKVRQSKDLCVAFNFQLQPIAEHGSPSDLNHPSSYTYVHTYETIRGENVLFYCDKSAKAGTCRYNERVTMEGSSELQRWNFHDKLLTELKKGGNRNQSKLCWLHDACKLTKAPFKCKMKQINSTSRNVRCRQRCSLLNRRKNCFPLSGILRSFNHQNGHERVPRDLQRQNTFRGEFALINLPIKWNFSVPAINQQQWEMSAIELLISVPCLE